jgi:YD repeat-containing protein
MRWAAIVAVITMLLVLPERALSQVGPFDLRDFVGPRMHDNQVIPGERIGSWRLNWQLGDFLKWNGEGVSFRAPESFVAGLIAFLWSDLELTAFSPDRQKVVVLLTRDPAFRTNRGLTLGAPLPSVQQTYGQPTGAVPGERGTTRRLVYDELGLVVGVTDRVVELGVFQKGNARAIWRL